jgi:peptide/histidine transporter 3/4
VPRGLNLGKIKFGGPFTSEQVEDVKAFYGILKVLFSFGVVFFMDYAANSLFPFFALHTAPNQLDPDTHALVINGTLIAHILINNGLLSPLITIFCIPLHLCVLRPFISRYVPGMLKKMGLGMVLITLSLLTTMFMDVVVHMGSEYHQVQCMFRGVLVDGYNVEPFLFSRPTQSSALYVIQLALSALSHMLIYTGAFEFICSQSPHSMKGLLIGVLYAIRGLYQLVAALLTLPYIILDTSPLSCGLYFYLVNTVIGVIGVITYMVVARRYRYRVRDEVCNVYQYAEQYYSNPHQERFYDYDDDTV